MFYICFACRHLDLTIFIGFLFSLHDGNISKFDAFLKANENFLVDQWSLFRIDATILSAQATTDVLINKLCWMKNDLARKFMVNLIGMVTKRCKSSWISKEYYNIQQ